MSTGDSYGHCWGRNGEFCVAVGPATRTVGAQSRPVKPAIRPTGNSVLAQLGLTLTGSMCRKGDELSRNGPPRSMRNLLLLLLPRFLVSVIAMLNYAVMNLVDP